MYDDTYQAMCLIPYKPYLPSAWSVFANLKKDFYSSMAHYFTAVGILALREDNEDVRKRYSSHFTKSFQYKQFSDLHASLKKSWHPTDVNKPPPTSAGRHLLAQIQLKHAYQLIDECSTNLRLNKSLRKMTGLSECLKKYATLVTSKQKEVNILESEDCAELYEAESVIAHTTFPAIVIAPDFKKFSVEDLFRDLGPLSIFNARNGLCPARTVQLTRTVLCPGFGFSVKGDMPVSISSVEPNGLAAMCKVLPGDFIVAVADIDCKFSSHDEVVRHIRTAGDCLTMTIVSPKRHSLTDNSIHSFNSSTLSSANSQKSNNSSAANSVTHENDSGVGSCDGKNNTTKSSGGWFSSTLPSSFKRRENKLSCGVLFKWCGNFSGRLPQDAERPVRKKPCTEENSSSLSCKNSPCTYLSPEFDSCVIDLFSRKSCKEKDAVGGGSIKEKSLTKTKSHLHQNQNGGQVFTYNNMKDLKDKKSTKSPSSSAGSPWRVRSFLSLKKTKSDSKLSGSSFMNNINNKNGDFNRI
uniref:PDZ domain-containing protein n=1 Tax=Romanomermis culicivorax TaxID=13658 RepID=A0A915J7Z5_ROMCU